MRQFSRVRKPSRRDTRPTMLRPQLQIPILLHHQRRQPTLAHRHRSRIDRAASPSTHEIGAVQTCPAARGRDQVCNCPEAAAASELTVADDGTPGEIKAAMWDSQVYLESTLCVPVASPLMIFGPIWLTSLGATRPVAEMRTATAEEASVRRRTIAGVNHADE